MEEQENIINQTSPAPEQKLENSKKSKKATFIILIIILILIIAGVIYKSKITGNMIKSNNNLVLLKTSLGDIKIKLYGDMPITTGNFKTLAEKGFYNGVIFHRIIDGFMIQGGDPTGTGMGGPGYTIKDEFTHKPSNKNNRGTISMANAGPNTGGSQFFINLVNNNFLDSKHPVFGEVIEGMDIVDKIAKQPKDSNDKPLKEIKIIEAKLV
jgi:peptidylprolyl isomerase